MQAIQSDFCYIISMIIKADNLPDDPNLLKEMLVETQCRYEKENNLLREQINLLYAQFYGKKSEKGIADGGPRSMSLFDMPEPDRSAV